MQESARTRPAVEERAAQRLRTRSPHLMGPAVPFPEAAPPAPALPDLPGPVGCAPWPGSPVCEARRGPAFAVEYGASADALVMARLAQRATEGMEAGLGAMEADASSVGGAYFLRDRLGRYIGVFKPADEEPFAPNNPRSYLLKPGDEAPAGPVLRRHHSHSIAADGAYEAAGAPWPADALAQGPAPCLRAFSSSSDGGGSHATDAEAGSESGLSDLSDGMALGGSSPTVGLKRGIAPQTSAAREVAAYLLDAGLAGVPRTAMVSAVSAAGGAKRGSFQEFVQSEGCSEDWGPSLFRVEDVQAIAALDIRLLNQDRHTGNMLVSRVKADGTAAPPAATRCYSALHSASALSPPLPPSPFLRPPAAAASPRSDAGTETDADDIVPSPFAQSPFAALRIKAESFSPTGISQMPQASVALPGKRRAAQLTVATEWSAMAVDARAPLASPGAPAASPPAAATPPRFQPSAAPPPSPFGAQQSPPAARTELRLVPIDHGFSLPHPLACDEASLAWLDWPQCQRPTCAGVYAAVAAMDAEADLARLHAALGDDLPVSACMALRVGTALLQEGTAAGLALHDIAKAFAHADAAVQCRGNAVHRLLLRTLDVVRERTGNAAQSLADSLGAPPGAREALDFVALFRSFLADYWRGAAWQRPRLDTM